MQQTITEIKDTQRLQQSLINMTNNIRTRTEERIERVKNNVENIVIDVAQQSEQYLTDITDKVR